MSESARPAQSNSSPSPSRIGPYRIIDCLGEGGMGRVYLAEQSEPVQRRVALKVMRNPLASREAQLRFEAERQALARLQHSNVAQLFEAGTTEEGFPFFAMELVDGTPLVSYCDQHRLSLRRRLVLFCAVCEGVQHAHQKGILHRDLTPANILVTETGEQPVPKIIDFGIAKALDQPLVDETVLTGERVIGTPAYLSPEAIDPEQDIDTRSDVYALGVLLYELLVGVRPFETEGLQLLQVFHRIANWESTGLTSKWRALDLESRQRIAGRRGLGTSALRRKLRGDLNWIVLKAIAKDRNQRYGTPAELAAEIKRYLHYQPVEASPRLRLYQLGKFVRRHRGLLATLMLLVMAGAKYTYDLRREQQRTLHALTAADHARNDAQQVSDFLLEIFRVADPLEVRGSEITAREILDRGAERLDHELSDQPLVRARLFGTIGKVYHRLGLYQESVLMLRRTVELLRAEHRGDHPDLASVSAQAELAAALHHLGRYDEADQLMVPALADAQGLAAAEPERQGPARLVAEIEIKLGALRADQGESAAAHSLWRRAESTLQRLAETGTDPDPALLGLRARVLLHLGEHQAAAPLVQELAAIGRVDRDLAELLEPGEQDRPNEMR
jgi:non-specific serine/threonine protein kinase/serine/threonine-protein kinase